MLDYFYRPEDQQLFTGREEELSRLRICLLAPRPVDVHLSGLRRIGKTMLIKEFIRRLAGDGSALPVYINLEEISETPEDFAIKFIGWHIYWLQTGGERLPLPFLHLPGLLFEVQDQAVREAILPLVRELEKARPDRQRLLGECFAFPSELARLTGRRVALFLDEFQEITHLANFEQSRNALKLLRAAKDRASNVAWCICGSIVSEMEAIARTPESPLFNQFTHLRISPWQREDSCTLISKFIPDCEHRLAGLLHRYSAGSPFYLVHLLRRIGLFAGHGNELSESLVKRAFIAEILSPDGMIHAYCAYLYNISLQRARGYGVLRSLLDTIAVADEAMNQSELARHLKMTQGGVRINLQQLVEIGLLCERERRYYYVDSVLRYWVAYVQHGVEVSSFPRESDLTALIEELDRKYQTVATELGRSQEEIVRALMRDFNGQQVDGLLFGLSAPLPLPHFERVEPFLSVDGKTEIDALARGPETWAVEVKWKGKAAGIKELTTFTAKATPLANRLWFIAKAGFTAEAKVYAAEQGVMISSQRELGQLTKELRGEG